MMILHPSRFNVVAAHEMLHLEIGYCAKKIEVGTVN